MELVQMSDRVFYYPHQPEVDRPMLAYIKGDRFSLAIDAGYSAKHVDDFYRALDRQKLKTPDFTVLTHWHYDHTFGLHHICGRSISHRLTAIFLEREMKKAASPGYFDRLREQDAFFAKEYSDGQLPVVALPDLQFKTELTLSLGGATARIFHTVSPHSEDTVCIHIPAEGMLFLGDATSEDLFQNGYMDQEKLKELMETIGGIDCRTCILSHTEPLAKNALLDYLHTVVES